MRDASDLIEHDEVATGVFEDGPHDRPHLDGLLPKHHAQRAQSLVVLMDVRGHERRGGNAVRYQGLLVRRRRWMPIGLQDELRTFGVLGGDHRNPPRTSRGDVHLLHEAHLLRVELERLFLVINEQTAEGDSHRSLGNGLRRQGIRTTLNRFVEHSDGAVTVNHPVVRPGDFTQSPVSFARARTSAANSSAAGARGAPLRQRRAASSERGAGASRFTTSRSTSARRGSGSTVTASPARTMASTVATAFDSSAMRGDSLSVAKYASTRERTRSPGESRANGSLASCRAPTDSADASTCPRDTTSASRLSNTGSVSRSGERAGEYPSPTSSFPSARRRSSRRTTASSALNTSPGWRRSTEASAGTTRPRMLGG